MGKLVQNSHKPQNMIYVQLVFSAGEAPRLVPNPIGRGLADAAIAMRAFDCAVHGEPYTLNMPPSSSEELMQYKFGIEEAHGLWLEAGLPLTPAAIELMERYGLSAA